MKKLKKTEKFIIKAKNRFGSKFNYDKINYIDTKTKIDILCVEHNVLFSQLPADHLRGRNGCNICNKSKLTTDEFINRARTIHNNRYSYDETIYNGSHKKLNIKCEIHGYFEQIAHNHLNGYGCPKCIKKNITIVEFINKSNELHENKYDYSNVQFTNTNDKIKIICPIHGEFNQYVYSHLRGKGCQKCGRIEAANKLKLDLEQFIDKSNFIHNNKYNYNDSIYIGSHEKIIITCPIHGNFIQTPYDHISGHGCIKCTSSVSNDEKEISDFIQSLGISTITSSRSIINPSQIDIFIPSHNIGIEYNGLYWHSEVYKDRNYHLNKTISCETKGIKLIHIFEDEWIFKKDIVKSRLKNIFGLSANRIYARKCQIKIINKGDKKKFLDTNHIQGSCATLINLGLYYNDELVSLMTFNKSRIGIGVKHDGYELTRFCNKIDTSVIGGFSKLLKYFIKVYDPREIISYADRRWSQGDVYKQFGFNIKHYSKPNYTYIINKNRKHRFNFRKSILVKQGYDKTKSEHQIMLERGIYRIYDCGTICFHYSTKEKYV